MSALRPLILQPDSAPYGANRALLRAISAMPQGAVRPLAVFPYAGEAIAEYEAAGCDVVISDLAVMRRTGTSPRALLALARSRRSTGRALGDLAKREGCDLVHTNSMTLLGGDIAARRAGIAHVWQLREAPRERGFKAKALSRLLRRADRVVAITRAAAELGPADTTIVHDGYDVPDGGSVVESRIASPGELIVGMVGRISPSKGQATLAEALELLASRGVPGIRAVVAGTVYPGYEPYAEQLVGRVEAVGWLDSPEPLLRQLDVLVVATERGEGFSLAALEALAHGVPVVSCATGGIEELVLDGQTGIVCRPGSAADVADALEWLAEDVELRNRLGSAGREHAQQFTVVASATGLLDIWRSVAAQH